MEAFKILIIIVSITYIWNYSGFIFDLSKSIYKFFNKSKPYKGQPLPKPFSCALCMIFWTVFLYGLFGIGLSLLYCIGIGVGSALFSLVVDKLIAVFMRLINKIK